MKINENDLSHLRSHMTGMLTNLEITVANTRSVMKESSEVIPNFLQDESDSAKGEIDLENALTVHNHSATQIGLLKKALARIDRGVYGACHDCGDKIGLLRLRAIPSAVHCIECQRAYEFGLVPEPRPYKSANYIHLLLAA